MGFRDEVFEVFRQWREEWKRTLNVKWKKVGSTVFSSIHPPDSTLM